MSSASAAEKNCASKRVSCAGMKMRRVRADDARQLARSCYDSFLTFNQRVGIPQRLDHPYFESAVAEMKSSSSDPAVHGVVAVNESSDAIMEAGFLTPGELYEIGPIFADNKFKGRGAAKATTVSLLEKAKSDNARSIHFNQECMCGIWKKEM